MSFGRLALKDLLRNPLRLVLTILAAAVGVFAFVFLQTVIHLFYYDVQASRADRLVVRNKASFLQPLPLSYFPRIANLPGVSAATFEGWFGGKISDRAQDFFANFDVDSASFLQVYDDVTVPPEEAAAFRADPCGAIAGEELARRFGWKLGGRIVLEGTIFPGDWVLTLRGRVRPKRQGVETNFLAFGYRCVNEKLPASRKNQVGLFVIRVDDPSRSTAVASAIDAMFENSPFPTKTESERAFQLGFIAMSSAIVAAVRIVSYIILLVLLLVIGNTLAMGVRERVSELATLRALGFRRWHLVALVLGESALIGLCAAAVGIAIAPWVIHAFADQVSKQLGPMPKDLIATSTLWASAAAAVAVALLGGAIPAVRAGRLVISDALRQVA